MGFHRAPYHSLKHHWASSWGTVEAIAVEGTLNSTAKSNISRCIPVTLSHCLRVGQNKSPRLCFLQLVCSILPQPQQMQEWKCLTIISISAQPLSVHVQPFFFVCSLCVKISDVLLFWTRFLYASGKNVQKSIFSVPSAPKIIQRWEQLADR